MQLTNFYFTLAAFCGQSTTQFDLVTGMICECLCRLGPVTPHYSTQVNACFCVKQAYCVVEATTMTSASWRAIIISENWGISVVWNHREGSMTHWLLIGGKK